ISTFVGMYITLRLIPLTGYLLSRESMVISLFMFSVFIGGLIGIVAPFILASGLAQFGDWLGGKAGGRSILRILVYSLLPLIMAFAILLIKLAFLKEAYLFPDAVEQLNEGTLLFLSILDKIEYVLWTWSFVLLVFGLAYVQDFHFLIAIFNLLFLVFGPFLFFRLIIEGFSSSWRKPRK
ncbi:MAG: YIP1 family protein, partial [Bacteroidota bacterium]